MKEQTPSKKKSEPLPAFGSLLRISEPEEDESEKKEKSYLKYKHSQSPERKDRLSRCMKVDGDEDTPGEENGVLFWVNRGGFPVETKTWERMWDHACKINPHGNVHQSRYAQVLPQVPIPQAPLSFPVTMSIDDKIQQIQKYINELQYNHTGTQFFEIKKNRPLCGLMETAREMISESLPIKCLEAVILALYLTNGFIGVERFTVSFKSLFSKSSHRHVVLGLYYSGRWGALGSSRRDDLMFKPLAFKSLSELILDYERAYVKYGHELMKVKLGLPIPHDPLSYEQICWKALNINVAKLNLKEMSREIEGHSKEIRVKAKSWTATPYSPKKPVQTPLFHDVREPVPPKAGKAEHSRVLRSQTMHADRSPTRRKEEHRETTEYQIRI